MEGALDAGLMAQGTPCMDGREAEGAELGAASVLLIWGPVRIAFLPSTPIGCPPTAIGPRAPGWGGNMIIQRQLGKLDSSVQAAALLDGTGCKSQHGRERWAWGKVTLKTHM